MRPVRSDGFFNVCLPSCLRPVCAGGLVRGEHPAALYWTIIWYWPKQSIVKLLTGEYTQSILSVKSCVIHGRAMEGDVSLFIIGY